MYKRIDIDFHGRKLSVETGKTAKQASGAVTVICDDNVVLVTAVADEGQIREGGDFIPLTVNYQEKFFSTGKIPGGFFKREGRPTDVETLYSRMIDRPIRPLFTKGWNRETQIIPTVFSSDQEMNLGVLALLGASAALEISDIPFDGPIAAVAVGRVDGQLVFNPNRSQLEQSDLDLVVAGNRRGIVMVEGGARMISEADLLDALYRAHGEIQVLLDLQDQLRREVGKPKRDFEPAKPDDTMRSRIEDLMKKDLDQAWDIPGKIERHTRLKEIKLGGLKKFIEKDPGMAGHEESFWSVLEHIEKDMLRGKLIKTGKRVDGRGPADIRNITCEVGALPRTHGSALFTRGETQALVVTTLGTRDDEKRIERIDEEYFKTFYLHYNFPPYSVGEVSMRLGPGRREIGHGMLAERALARVLPAHLDFPYTIRVVSEILESNGSSSMATVCGGSLSLMEAGVPISAQVAGIAMGLVKVGEGDFHILSDIMGDEDHLGDMDFKVAGTSEGITAVQMDIKGDVISRDIMARALAQAREGRLHILEKMNAVISQPKAELSPYAPRIVTLQVPIEKIKDVIGPGGKVIRAMIEKTGATIDIDDTGTVHIASMNGEKNDEVIRMIKEIIQEAEVGKVYTGQVRRITDFGAFVEIFPGTDGLVHISQLEHRRVAKVTDVLHEGDMVTVKCIGIDDDGKVSLSRKALLEAPPRDPNQPEEQPRERREFHDRGGPGDRDRNPRRRRPRE